MKKSKAAVAAVKEEMRHIQAECVQRIEQVQKEKEAELQAFEAEKKKMEEEALDDGRVIAS